MPPQPGSTPIISYHTTTALAVPSAGNLSAGELAINVTDKKIYTKDGGGALITVVGTLGNQNDNAVAITGGNINGTVIGNSTAAAASVTTLTATADSSFTSTGAVKIPVGTSGQQPGTPTQGMIRYNTSTPGFEGYSGAAWGALGGTGFLVAASNLSDVANTTTARGNISAAKSGANSDITSLSGLTTPLSVAQGGTNSTATPTAGGVVYGTGTAHAITTAGTAGQVLTSNNGSAPTWATPSSAAGLQSFTTSGTFTIPGGITKVKVTVIGGGGNGGATVAGGDGFNLGGGGGAGGNATKFLSGLTPFNTITVTIGAAGGASSISSGTQTITTVTATGGTAGPAGINNSQVGGGTGGTGSGGDINGTGQSGGAGISTPASGMGGSTIFGGGGKSIIAPSVGNAGTLGSGGSGASAIDSVARAGGAGGTGIIVFEW